MTTRDRIYEAAFAATLLSGLAILSPVVAIADAAADPIAHYTFDEGPPDVIDQSGSGNGGTLYSGASFAPLDEGHALELNGRTSFAKCAHHRRANLGASGFTIAARLKLDTGDDGVVLGKKGPTAEARGWMLRYDAADQRLVFEIADGEQMASVSAPYNDQSWHHVAVVRQGDAVAIYVDGVSAGEERDPVFAADVTNEAVFLHLGKVVGYTSVKGLLDDVTIWPVAMNASEVEERHDAARVSKPASPAPTDPLLLHYTFDNDPEGTVTDRSGYGHDAKAVNTEYFDELDGRHGVLRFSGSDTRLELGQPDGLTGDVDGDMTVEMWVRRNGPMTNQWGIVFGEYPARSFFLVQGHYHTLMLFHRNIESTEQGLVPTDPDLIDEEWAHVAVVVEYPRCRFYRNGKLVRDAYMPIDGTRKFGSQAIFIGGSKEDDCLPMDLDEFRFHRRALSAEELAAHARDEEAVPAPSHALAADTHWYDRTVTLRLNSKNVDFTGHEAEFTLRNADGETVLTRRAAMDDGATHVGRYLATVTFPLEGVEGGEYDATARVIAPNQQEIARAEQPVSFIKPAWVDTKAGHSDEVPAPWNAVDARQDGAGVEVGVWGRRYVLAEESVVDRIVALDEELLVAPVTLNAAVTGKPVEWSEQRVALTNKTPRAATIEQTRRADDLSLTIQSTAEFDGYIVFDCSLTAERDVTLDELTLDIPLRSEYAELCYGDQVLVPKPGIGMSAFYSGAVEGDLAFHFGPTVWLGNQDRGLTWQSESNEDWRNADPERAIEVLPREERTTLRAHFVDEPTRLKRGESLHYKFALQASPIKPMGGSAWDLRIMRSGPYGNELHLPDRKIGDKPILDYLGESGVRHFWYQLLDQWPHPTPVAEEYIRALRRLIDSAHAGGMKIHPYLLHQRYPVIVPEYDVHGLHMTKRPQRTYLQAYGPVDDASGRPGPIPVEWGAGPQGCVFACPKSMALQDSYVHALAERLATFNEDGVYLDGTVHLPSCSNELHGCGYRDESGELHTTFPVFAVRSYLQRIHQVVKQDDPANIVDIHCSWGYNPPALAYGDIMLTGEQWHHLRHSGAEHIPDELTLDMFRTEFFGQQIGIAADLLSYRLGSTMKMAAVSLLHDVPVRLNQGGRDPAVLAGVTEELKSTAPSGGSADNEKSYFELLTKLWRVREEFGANEAKKLFYWENAGLVRLSSERCHALLFVHPSNGVLAFVTNLSREEHDVRVALDLEKLGLTGDTIEAFDALNDQPVSIDPRGEFTTRLGSAEWTYVWVRSQAR